MNRIHRLLRQPGEPRSVASLLLSMGLVVGMFCLFAAAQQANPNAQAEEKQKQETPYRKWLNEDVVYIIADKERTAFERLRTDQEREHFIEQFWQRRDPKPETPENEFKQEHYRRIAYANERFASTSAPGWRTDRGRIYVRHGPPDEIESHPGFEHWRYRHIEGIGDDVRAEFADRNHSGEYRLTGAPAPWAPAKK